jgi:hypothetical protein
MGAKLGRWSFSEGQDNVVNVLWHILTSTLGAVLCAGVATLFLQIGQDLWATIAHCLQTFKSPWVRVEALRLLSLLAVSSPRESKLSYF